MKILITEKQCRAIIEESTYSYDDLPLKVNKGDSYSIDNSQMGKSVFYPHSKEDDFKGKSGDELKIAKVRLKLIGFIDLLTDKMKHLKGDEYDKLDLRRDELKEILKDEEELLSMYDSLTYDKNHEVRVNDRQPPSDYENLVKFNNTIYRPYTREIEEYRNKIRDIENQIQWFEKRLSTVYDSMDKEEDDYLTKRIDKRRYDGRINHWVRIMNERKDEIKKSKLKIKQLELKIKGIQSKMVR